MHLPFVSEKTGFSDEMWNGTAQPGENFPELKECLRRYSSLFVSTEMTGISCTIGKNLTRAILSPMVDDFVNLGTSCPHVVGASLLQWLRVHPSFLPSVSTIYQVSIGSKNSMQMASAPTFRMFSLRDLCFVLCSCDLDVLRVQSIMGFCCRPKI